MNLNYYCKAFSLIVVIALSSHSWAVEAKSVAYYGEVEGYLALPDERKEEQYPAILLIHEWWGLNEDIKAKAEEFAKAGYVALAVDLYDGKVATKPRGARALAIKVRDNREDAFKNLKAAFTYLKSWSQVDEQRLASVGWCFGGAWSYQIAKNDLGAKASIIYYGRFNPADDLAKMRASILGHFAEKDRGIRIDTVREFQAKLETLSGTHEIYIYPNTGHGFANPNNPIYNKKATKLAQKRTLAFLKKYL